MNNYFQQKHILEVQNVSVRKRKLFKDSWLVKNASFDIKSGEFVAIIGPNGAGKTKLVEAIMGDRPYSGQIFFNGEDIYDNPEHTFSKIGWLPAHPILHDDLTAKQALLKIGQLRLPHKSKTLIRNQAEVLMDEFDFPKNRRDDAIRNLSSGERKRIELCAELLSDPKLLILDEPTTNLDPDAERLLMKNLQQKTRDGQMAVLIITHTLQSLEFCDRIVFLAGGEIQTNGNKKQVLQEMERKLQISVSENEAERWAEIFKKSREHYKEETRYTIEKIKKPKRRKYRNNTTPDHTNTAITKQTRILLSRSWLLFANRFMSLLVYLSLGPISGLLSLMVLRDNAFVQDPDEAGYLTIYDTTDARQAMFVIALIVALLGLISSYLAITKERNIYEYEHTKGLSPLAYLLSKWSLLTILVGFIAPTMLVIVLTQNSIGLTGQHIPNYFFVLPTLWATCIAAITLGLAISAISDKEIMASGLLGAVTVFHVLFSGGVSFNENLAEFLDRISMFSASHWGVKGMSRSIQLYCWASVPRFQDYCSLGNLYSSWLFLGVYILVAFLLAYTILNLQIRWLSIASRLKKVFGGIMLATTLLSIVMISWSNFLQKRSQEYFDLSNTPNLYEFNGNIYENMNAYLSLSYCPTPTPPPTPIVQIASLPTFGTEVPVVPPTLTVEPQQTPTSESVIPTATLTPFQPTQEALPTTTPEPQHLAPLPIGAITTSTELRYGPDNASIEGITLNNSAPIILLGKDQTEQWARIKEENTNLIGWVPIHSISISPTTTGTTASPPQCAQPIGLLTDIGSKPSVTWLSTISGHVVAIIDLHRPDSGNEFPPTDFNISSGGKTLTSYSIPNTRQSFVFRGRSIDLSVDLDDLLEFSLEQTTEKTNDSISLQVVLFAVPRDCDFNQ